MEVKRVSECGMSRGKGEIVCTLKKAASGPFFSYTLPDLPMAIIIPCMLGVIIACPGSRNHVKHNNRFSWRTERGPPAMLCALRRYNKAYRSQGMLDITRQSMHWLEWHDCEGGGGHSQSVQFSGTMRNPHKDNVWKPRRPCDSCVWQIANSAWRGRGGGRGTGWNTDNSSTYWPTTTAAIKPTKNKKKLWFHDKCMKSVQTIINIPCKCIGVYTQAGVGDQMDDIQQLEPVFLSFFHRREWLVWRGRASAILQKRSTCLCAKMQTGSGRDFSHKSNAGRPTKRSVLLRGIFSLEPILKSVGSESQIFSGVKNLVRSRVNGQWCSHSIYIKDRHRFLSTKKKRK